MKKNSKTIYSNTDKQTSDTQEPNDDGTLKYGMQPNLYCNRKPDTGYH